MDKKKKEGKKRVTCRKHNLIHAQAVGCILCKEEDAAKKDYPDSGTFHPEEYC